MLVASGVREPQGFFVACGVPNAYQWFVDGWHEDPQVRDIQDHCGLVVPALFVPDSLQDGQRAAVYAADAGGAWARAGE